MAGDSTLWTERYRPTTLDDYVWINEGQKQQVERWIKDGFTPDVILSGGPGCGKSSLVKLLMKLLKVESGDYMYINGSKKTGVDKIDKLSDFCETMPSGRFRYVHLDEADGISWQGQDALKAMTEDYTSVCRWIFTTNKPHKIIPPLHSRLQGFHIESLDREQFMTKVATILITEGVDLNESNADILDEYISATYPDLRKCINSLQQNCQDGILKRPTTTGASSMTEYMVNAVSLFKNGKIHEARKLICENASHSDYEEIYKLLYRNVDWFGKTEKDKHSAIVIIANRLRDHTLIADPEIALSACLVELSML